MTKSEDKDLDEVMEEAGMLPKEEQPKPTVQANIPEAVASITYSIKTKSGFNALFTVRDISGVSLIEKMSVIEDKFSEKGVLPQPEKSYGAKREVNYVQGRVCPLDGGRLIEKVSSAGKKYIACENGKYDFNTKKTLGCQFVEWST